MHNLPILALDDSRRSGVNEIFRRHVVDERDVISPQRVARACGKIILSGNISNAYGKRALAVPVDMHVAVTWNNRENTQDGLRFFWDGHCENGVWLNTTQKIITLIEASVGRLSGKLTIQNTLPLGKGMGSSTAIVVALARCFLGNHCKDEALAIEDVINKGHSGIDFAAIWEERPIVITNGRYEVVDLPKRLQQGFLIDTGLPTEPTSAILQRLKERFSRDKILTASLETIGNCTERLLSGEDPITVFPDHNRGQVGLGLVPARVQSLIENIEQSGGAAKAVRSGSGTGGSGMVFAVHPKGNVLKSVLGIAAMPIVYDPLHRRFIDSKSLRGEPSREKDHTTTPFPASETHYNAARFN